MDVVKEWIEQAASDNPAVMRILASMRNDAWLPPAWSCYSDARRSVARCGQGAVDHAPLIWRSYFIWLCERQESPERAEPAAVSA